MYFLAWKLNRSSVELSVFDSRALTICNLLNILTSHCGYCSSALFPLLCSWNPYCSLNAVGLGLKEILAGSMLCSILLPQQCRESGYDSSFPPLIVQMQPELEATLKIEELSPVLFVAVSLLILRVSRHINYSCQEEILNKVFIRNFSPSGGEKTNKQLFASKDFEHLCSGFSGNSVIQAYLWK